MVPPFSYYPILEKSVMTLVVFPVVYDFVNVCSCQKVCDQYRAFGWREIPLAAAPFSVGLCRSILDDMLFFNNKLTNSSICKNPRLRVLLSKGALRTIFSYISFSSSSLQRADRQILEVWACTGGGGLANLSFLAKR